MTTCPRGRSRSPGVVGGRYTTCHATENVPRNPWRGCGRAEALACKSRLALTLLCRPMGYFRSVVLVYCTYDQYFESDPFRAHFQCAAGCRSAPKPSPYRFSLTCGKP
jgi:hypothetical protein